MANNLGLWEEKSLHVFWDVRVTGFSKVVLAIGDYLTFACGIVRDYLNKDLGQELSCLYPYVYNVCNF